jgi:hypothetical protein
VDLVLNINGALAQFDAEDDAQVIAAGITEAQVAAAFAANLPATFTITTTPITIVPQVPAAIPGVFPGIANMPVVVQRRSTPTTAGEEAIAILFNFQNRPNTPAARPLGNPALVTTTTFGVAQDLLLEIENTFLSELIASLVLEAPVAPPPGVAAGLGVPAALVGVTGATGITLLAPVGVTLGGRAGLLTVFTLTPPPPGPLPPGAGPPAMTLSVTFVFTLDDITYTVTITGATLAIGLAGLGIVISATIPPAVVTSFVPWWVVVGRVLAGALLGFAIAGPIGAIVGAVVGGVSVVVETAIVGAIAGPSAESGLGTAIGGAGGGLVPAGLAGLLGGATLSPPLIFDDLQVGGRASVADVVQIRRQVNAVELDSGESIDLDRLPTLWDFTPGRKGRPSFDLRGGASHWDLVWDALTGLRSGPRARLVRLTGRFAMTTFADASGALAGGDNEIVGPSDFPVLTAEDVAAGRRRQGVVIAVKTDAGRVAKAIAWKDSDGHLILRYLVWDTSAAAARIFPTRTQWIRTQTVRDPDTPGTSTEPPVFHFRYAHRAVFRVRTNRMSAPLSIRWMLTGTTLAGNAAGTASGAAIAWEVVNDTMTLNVGLGDSFDGDSLECEVVDANGVTASDSVQLRVAGREDRPESEIEANVRRIKDRIDAIIGRLHERPPGGVKPTGPAGPVDPLAGVMGRDIETSVFSALEMGGVRLDPAKVRIR